MRAPAILPAGILIPALILSFGCYAGEPSSALPDPHATAEQALASAERLRARATERTDRLAMGQLVSARQASRFACRHDLEIRALTEIGALEYRHDRLAASRLAFEQALLVARREGDLAGQAAALNGVTDALFETSREAELTVAQAIVDYREALRLSRAARHPVLEGRSLYNLGNAFLAKGDLAESLRHFEEALDIQSRAGDASSRRLTLLAISQIYLKPSDLADEDKGRQILQSTLEESRRARDLDAEAHLEMELGTDFMDREAYEDAVRSFDRVRVISERAGTRFREGIACVQLATAYRFLGERDRSTELYEHGIDLLEQQSRARGVELLPLLPVYFFFLGTHQQPEIGFAAVDSKYYRPALRMVETGPSSSDLTRERATSYHFYGQALNAAGKHGEALSYLTKCAPVLKDMSRIYLARNQLELGKAYRAAGKWMEAERELKGALAASQNLHEFLLEAVTRHEIARLERDRGRYREALAESSKTLRIIDDIRGKVASQQLRSSFFASRQMYYKFHLDLLMKLDGQDPRGRHDHAALEVSERARARVLLDLLAEGRIDITRAVPESLKSRQHELDQRFARLQSRLFRGQGEKLKEEIAKAERDSLQLEAAIRSESPRYAKILHPEYRKVDQIQRLLDDQTAFLEYALTEKSVILFVVTKELFQGFLLKESPEEVGEHVQRIRHSLRNSNFANFRRQGSDNHALYRSLLGAAQGLLHGKDRWLIAADGPLLLLNFEVLLTRPPEADSGLAQPYLLHEKIIHYVPSASVLAEIVERGSAPRSAPTLELFALADPELAATGDFPPLLAARQEVKDIEALFPRGASLIFEGRRATKKVLEDSRFGTSRRVHFATHATLDPRLPEKSALLLADSRLTVSEIFNLRLGAELVVLSACNTGQGKQVEGEGLVGMTRAFFYAGAPTLVVSLWPAVDTATADLMPLFYQEMGRTPDKAEALRAAKLKLAKDYGPYYWAPFILLGRGDARGT